MKCLDCSPARDVRVTAVFTEAKQRLASHIVNYGFVESRDDYQRILASADVVVSTARHEFFGVAM